MRDDAVLRRALPLGRGLGRTDIGGAVLTLMLGYRSFIHYIGTPQKSLHRVTIRNDSPGLAGRVVQIDGLNQRSNCLINNQDHGVKHGAWVVVNCM